MEIKTVLCFGSGVRGDSAPFAVCQSLTKEKPMGERFRFVSCDSPIDIMAYIDDGETIIMDSVKGIGEVTLFSKLDDFLNVESVSAHDLDLGTFLKVLEGMGKLSGVKLVGVPFGSAAKDAASGVARILSYL